MSISSTNFDRTDVSQFDSNAFKTTYFSEYFDIIRCIPGAYIAGGFMVHWWNTEKFPTKDIDIFFTDDKAIQKVRNELLDLKWQKCANSPYMCEDWEHPNHPYKVQLILGAIYDSVFHIIDGFDLRCCMMACDADSLYYHKETKNDLDTNTIVIHRMRDIVKVKEHVIRYMSKGMILTIEAFETIFKMTYPNPTKLKEIIYENPLDELTLKGISKRIIKWIAQ